MSFPKTISWYFAKNFVAKFFLALAVCAFLAFVIDTIELLRRGSGKEHITSLMLIEIGLLRLPDMILKIVPFAVLIGAIMSFTSLTRSSEFVIARASGLSVWQFLRPAVICAVLLGLFIVTTFNPIASLAKAEGEAMNNKYLKRAYRQLIVSKDGLWIKQKDPEGLKLIHALRKSDEELKLFDVVILEFNNQDKFTGRLDAKSAALKSNNWFLQDVLINSPNERPKELKTHYIKTNISPMQVHDSLMKPEELSFWQLPDFIKNMEKAGFSANRYKIYYQSLLATPLIFAAMVLIAAVFSLRLTRRGGIGLLVVAGLFSGFLFFFATKLSTTFGVAGTIPIVMASWVTPVVFLLFAISALLHLEDG